jgi:hypothetical protein
MDALRDPVTAHPPQNMKRGLIFLGVVVMVCCFLPVFGLEGKQARREIDQNKADEQATRAAKDRTRSRDAAYPSIPLHIGGATPTGAAEA